MEISRVQEQVDFVAGPHVDTLAPDSGDGLATERMVTCAVVVIGAVSNLSAEERS